MLAISVAYNTESLMVKFWVNILEPESILGLMIHSHIHIIFGDNTVLGTVFLCKSLLITVYIIHLNSPSIMTYSKEVTQKVVLFIYLLVVSTEHFYIVIRICGPQSHNIYLELYIVMICLYFRLYIQFSVPKMVSYVCRVIFLVVYLTFLGKNNKLQCIHHIIRMISLLGGSIFRCSGESFGKDHSSDQFVIFFIFLHMVYFYFQGNH